MACYKGSIGCVNAEDVWLGLNDAMQWDMGHPFKFISDLNNDPEDNKSITTMKVIVLMMAIAVSFFIPVLSLSSNVIMFLIQRSNLIRKECLKKKQYLVQSRISSCYLINLPCDTIIL